MTEAMLTKSRWMQGGGPEIEIVVSSRVRLARNLMGEAFPCLAAGPQNRAVIDRVITSAENDPALKSFSRLRVEELSALDKQTLMEKHLISPYMAREAEQGAILVSADEAISIMVNEEDHLRIQAILPGLQLEEALGEADRIDDIIEKSMPYAFHEQYGYLTACPTNMGTGLRASVMLHLPALIRTRQLNRILGALSQVGLTVRGLYGEGTEITGSLVQVSNQVTLGLTEEEIIANLHSVTCRVIEQEQAARQSLLDKNRAALADSAWRALGLLQYAQVMSIKEAVSLISDLRLGYDLGLIKSINHRLLNELLVLIRPGYLQNLAGKSLNESERDLERPVQLRKALERYRDEGEEKVSPGSKEENKN